jgi:fructose-1,6-bisphosphatase I
MDEIIECLKDSFSEISLILRESNLLEMSNLIKLQNKSGDSMKKIDYLSNDIIKNNLKDCKEIRNMCSEEETEMVPVNSKGKYLVSFDPLDGSSNVNSNISVGSIFCIFEYIDDEIKGMDNILAAGYTVYGICTQLIIAKNNNVNMYQLKHENGFKLMKENVIVPENGSSYAINEGNKHKWLDPKINDYVNKLIETNKTQRWVGSLVADANRILINGGVFMYPKDKKSKDGKIRLLYEAYPMAFIFKCAKGYSNISNIPFPKDLHKKIPIFLFGKEEYNLYLNNI